MPGRRNGIYKDLVTRRVTHIWVFESKARQYGKKQQAEKSRLYLMSNKKPCRGFKQGSQMTRQHQIFFFHTGPSETQRVHTERYHS